MTLAIYGPGGFGSELISIATFGGRAACFLSDSAQEIGGEMLGLPIYSVEQVCAERDKADIAVVIAVAAAGPRRRLADRLEAAGLRVGSLLAPSAVVGPGVELREGAILCHFTTITSSARIGRHFHANIYSYVAHDCVVGDFVTLAPRVCVNGNTIVEDDVYIGTGAVLKQGVRGKPLRIGKGAVIGMGAVVTKDVEPGAVVVGNPARPLERK